MSDTATSYVPPANGNGAQPPSPAAPNSDLQIKILGVIREHGGVIRKVGNRSPGAILGEILGRYGYNAGQVSPALNNLEKGGFITIARDADTNGPLGRHLSVSIVVGDPLPIERRTHPLIHQKRPGVKKKKVVVAPVVKQSEPEPVSADVVLAAMPSLATPIEELEMQQLRAERDFFRICLNHLVEKDIFTFIEIVREIP